MKISQVGLVGLEFDGVREEGVTDGNDLVVLFEV